MAPSERHVGFGVTAVDSEACAALDGGCARKPLRTLPPLNSYCSEASRSGGHETGPGNPQITAAPGETGRRWGLASCGPGTAPAAMAAVTVATGDIR